MSDELRYDAPARDDEETPPVPQDHTTLCRQRARDALDAITVRIKDALAERGIMLDLFLLVPGGGGAILMFGTTVEPDPSDEQWALVSEVVTKIVEEAVGLGRTRTRDVVCASVQQAA